jgi:hypothetical protein
MSVYYVLSYRGVISGTLRGQGLVLCSLCPKFGCLYRLRYAEAESTRHGNNAII